jgi:hypothetical protein
LHLPAIRIFIWIKFVSLKEGDQMKNMFLLITALCLLTLSLTGISTVAGAQSPEGQVIYSYEGNITEKEIIPVDLLSILGAPGYFFAEAVKFKAPKANWKINAVQLYGWDGFNGSEETIPSERIISLEIRDKDLDLLYKFADSQLPYSNYARNATTMYPLTLNIPQVSVSDEFYVCFYDRGAIAVGSERLNETSKNSFIYIEGGEQLLPAALPTGENASIPLNWLMKISGS